MSRALLALVLALSACDASSPPPDAGADAGTGCTSDEQCANATFCDGAEICMAGECLSVDACQEGQTCDEDREVCVTDCTVARDADGDGADARECGGLDCDDSDPERFPGATEVCDTADRDEDCDPSTFGFRDGDMDGTGSARCCNVDPETDERLCGGDCDDARPGASPTATETCNTLDDDCDGAIDESVVESFWIDADGDGYGSAAAGAMRMDTCVRPRGFAPTDDDCDDASASINPSAVDACDAAMLDEDCSGTPNDPTGGCTCTGAASRSCGLPGRCASGVQSCAGGAWGACSTAPVPEACNAEDDDCDGTVDEGQTITCYRDADGDGLALFEAAPVQRCPDPARTAEPWLGCPDLYTAAPPITPGGSDCDDTETTLGLPIECWTDGDDDGWGSGDPSWVCPTRCEARLATRAGDCCDTDDRARPDQTSYFPTTRTCGGYDYDCSGTSDLRWGQAPCMQTGPMACTGHEGFDRPGVPCGTSQFFFVSCDWFTNMFGSGCTRSWGDPATRPQQCR